MLTLGGCGHGGGEALVDVLHDYHSESEALPDIAHDLKDVNPNELKALDRSNGALKSFGSRLTPEGFSALTQSDRFLAYHAADQETNALHVGASNLANDDALNRAIEGDLEVATEKWAQAFACSEVHEALLEPDQFAAGSWTDVATNARTTLLGAVQGTLEQRYAPAYVLAVVNWTSWAQGAGSLVNELESAKGLTQPESSLARSRAFYYFVRFCEAPPTSTN